MKRETKAFGGNLGALAMVVVLSMGSILVWRVLVSAGAGFWIFRRGDYS